MMGQSVGKKAPGKALDYLIAGGEGETLQTAVLTNENKRHFFLLRESVPEKQLPRNVTPSIFPAWRGHVNH
jgi:hypothetical protein